MVPTHEYADQGIEEIQHRFKLLQKVSLYVASANGIQ
jgi:hypothetical protein